jgi:hypothetical protein
MPPWTADWSPVDLLPGLWAAVLAVLLLRALRRWYDPVPGPVAAAFGLVLLILFGPVLFGGKLLLPLDNLRGQVPFQELKPTDPHGNILQGDLIELVGPSIAEGRAVWDTGRWPLWNAHAGAGMPLLADPQAQALQPLVLVSSVIPWERAAAVTAALRVLLGLVFTFLWIRAQGPGSGPAAAGAFAFGLGGFLLLWVGWPIANAAALLPAVLYGLARVHRHGGRRDLLLLALAAFGLLLAGHPETVLYSLGVVLAVLVAQALAGGGREKDQKDCKDEKDVRLRRMRQAIFALLVAGLAAAPALLPAAAYLPQTLRATRVREGSIARPAPAASRREDLARRLLPIAVPNAYGNSRFVDYWGLTNTNEDAGGFVGTAALLAALLSLRGCLGSRRQKTSPPSPLPSPPLPPGEGRHHPSLAARPDLPFPPLPAVGRAMGEGGQGGEVATARLSKHPPRGSRRFPLERLALGGVLLCLLVLAHPPGLSRVWPAALLESRRLLLILSLALAFLAACTLERFRRGETDRWTLWMILGAVALLAAVVVWGTLAHPDPADPGRLAILRFGWVRWQMRFLGLSAILLGAALFVHQVRRWVPPAVACLIAAELLLLHRPANPPMPRRLAFPVTGPIRFLQENARRTRVAALGRSFPPNLAGAYGLTDVRVYNPMAPRAYLDWIAPITSGWWGEVPELGAPLDPLYQRLSVRYLLTEPDARLPEPLRRVFADPSGAVWELPGPFPRLFLLPTEGTLRIEALEADHLQARVELPRPGAFLSSVYQDGGWRMLRDGEPWPTAPADGPFVEARLPAGVARVDLLYRPEAFVWGCVLAALGLAFGAAAFIPGPASVPSRE